MGKSKPANARHRAYYIRRKSQREGDESLFFCDKDGSRIRFAKVSHCAFIVSSFAPEQQARIVMSWDCWVDPVHGGAAARADLATGEICRGLGLLYDWLYDALSEQERAEIREALVNRGIVPVYERSIGHAFWATHHTNWCAVVHGGAGLV